MEPPKVFTPIPANGPSDTDVLLAWFANQVLEYVSLGRWVGQLESDDDALGAAMQRGRRRAGRWECVPPLERAHRPPSHWCAVPGAVFTEKAYA